MTQPYIVGVGAANLDLSGASIAPIRLRDSNPGHIRLSAGGVTRNVLDNLSRLGADVKLLSAIGCDAFGEQILRESRAAGIDVDAVWRTDQAVSSMYLSILDSAGDMLVAMSDMTIIQSSLPDGYLTQHRALIRGARIVTCDPCIRERALEELLDLCGPEQTVCVDPVSTAYARIVAPYIGRFHTAKPNRMELEILAGLPVETDLDLARAGERLLQQGLHRLFVSLGSEGCFYMDDCGRILRKKLRPAAQMVNASGAGDAFTAAMLYATLKELPPERTLDLALAAGLAALSYPGTINPSMSLPLLDRILKENSI